MFARGRGRMHDWLKRSGRDMSDCGLGSPVRHLERSGYLAGNLLAMAFFVGGQIFLVVAVLPVLREGADRGRLLLDLDGRHANPMRMRR